MKRLPDDMVNRQHAVPLSALPLRFNPVFHRLCGFGGSLPPGRCTVILPCTADIFGGQSVLPAALVSFQRL